MPKLPPIGAKPKPRPTKAPVVRGPQVSMLDRLAADDAGDGDDLPPPSSASKQPTLASLDSWIVQTVAVPSEEKSGGYRPWGDRWTMQLEYVNCGRCPKAHGPYWYAYKRGEVDYSTPRGTPGKLYKVYVGKTYDVDAARKKLQAVGACR